jgi:hypothetical protein
VLGQGEQALASLHDIADITLTPRCRKLILMATSNQPPVLGTRALNRTLLARQLLLERVSLPAAKVVERLVGMQAQTPESPYYALWARLRRFRPEELARLLEGRKVVRLSMMRSTIHLVSAADCLALRPVLQPVQERNLFTASPYGRRLAGMDLAALVRAGRALLEEQPRSIAELAAGLRTRWPKRDGQSMAYGIRNLLAMVQVPPRGLWGQGGLARGTTAERWLGRPLGRDRSPDRLVLRYLAAFGPASARDVEAWSGLQGLEPVLEGLRRLRRFQDQKGTALYDLPRAPRPDPDTPAPPRFLPDYDNVFLGHADRTRIVDETLRLRHRSGVDMRACPFLLDGFIAGSWRIDRRRPGATLTIAPWARLAKKDASALADEGLRLLEFAAPEDAHDVRFLAPG